MGVIGFFDGFNDLTFCEFGFSNRIGSKLEVLPTYNQSEFFGNLQR
jgi:hypothetical protein